jgi:nucleotide-binding universal stress UspA family protein
MVATQQVSIVAGTDGSLAATEAVKHAAELAHAEQAMLHVVTAAPTGTEAELAAARRALEETERALAGIGVPVQ